jgi:phenylacetate-CoA ligase
MRHIQGLEPDRIKEFQMEKFRRLLEYASKHVPYYRGLLGRLGLACEDFRELKDVCALPIIRKSDINRDMQSFVSEEYPRRDLIPDNTSGSTGENLYFYRDKLSDEAGRSNVVRMNEWIGVGIGDRIANLWSVPFEVSLPQRVKRALKAWFMNTTVLSHFRMDDQTLRSYARRLHRFRPALIMAYPSALTRLSEFIMDSESETPSPRAIVVSGETLYEWQRETIEQALGAPVYNHYGSREFMGIARECRLRHGLHIASERMLVEAVPVPGVPSEADIRELVITDLDNYGMPFLRYATGDVGEITWDECGCGLGLPRLLNVTGRTLDIIQAPNGNYLGGSFWTLLTRRVKGIKEFQVVQDEIGKITFRIVPADEFSDDGLQYLAKTIAETCGPEMDVRFEIQDAIERTPAGKFRFVVSKIGPGSSG